MAKSTLDMRVEKEGDITVVVLDGPVDSATLASFKQGLDPVFRERGVKVLLDCTNLTYLNSKAIGLLARYRRDCYVGGGRLALCHLNTKLVRTVDLLGLSSLLKTYESREEAVGALQ
ncbi:MAG: STAS domain-containing protein [Kiritimatiellae bacterium]|nr:STAS domain-containing protein [Kiritimatiellia bacterium]